MGMLRPARIALLWVLMCGTCLAQGVTPAQETAPVAVEPLQPKTQGPTGTISGTVYCGDTNLPARLAQIIVEPASKGTARHSYRGESDLEGRFTIPRVPEGKYYVGAEITGYLNPLGNWIERNTKTESAEEQKALEARVATVFVTSKQTASASIRLERGAEIDGTVLYDDGSPAIGLNVSLRPKAEAPGSSSAVDVNLYVTKYLEAMERTTDDRGHFRILGVAPGEYLVSVTLSTATADQAQRSPIVQMMQSSPMGGLTVYLGDTLRASKAKTIKIAGGETRGDADITIPLGKLHTIRGQVVLKSTGLAPPTAAVQLLYADTRELARMVIAADGEFEISYVAEDSFILRAEASGEPLPGVDTDGEDGEGFLLSGIRLDAVETQATSDVAVMVTGNMSGITLAVPDPAPKKAAASAAPAETDVPVIVSPQ